jgi:Domain of unknown function (DUF1905)/Bacteriocin-protection, YdeI or OmpD-Associated
LIRFTTKILKFAEMGEKTGWTYIRISSAQALQLLPGNKKSFRVKGRLDDHPIQKMALIPMGEGDFIMALNAAVRKAIRKQQGASLKVELELDKAPIEPPKALLDCLADEPAALAYFKDLPKSHQNYFGTWVKSAKTEGTRTRRIACVVTAMVRHLTFSDMLRAGSDDNDTQGFFPK